MSKIKLRKELADNLNEMYYRGKGHSKHEAKLHGEDHHCIYSMGTLKAYKKEVNHFVDFCYEKGIKDFSTAKETVPEYLKMQIDNGMSASTIHLRASAIAKAFDCSYREFKVDLPTRHRSDYVRSRGEAVRDRSFSISKNAEIIEFCCSFGPRRRELERITGKDFFLKEDDLFIKITGKGGKTRISQFYGSNDVKQAIWSKACEKGENRLFERIPSHMDVHSYRSEYAMRVYDANKRPLEEIPTNEKYFCRCDRKGDVFDKKAMKITSRELGHNRIDVIAQSYLR